MSFPKTTDTSDNCEDDCEDDGEGESVGGAAAALDVSFGKIKVDIPTVSSPILPVKDGEEVAIKSDIVASSPFVSPTGKARSALLRHKKK